MTTKEKTKFTEEQLETIEASHLDMEIWEAGIEAGIDFDSIEEAYSGRFHSDEDFVQDLLEQTGDIPKNLPPYIHIDWEATARDVMMDYSEESGHYFRKL